MWTANAYIWQPGTFTQIALDRSAGGKNAKEEWTEAVLILKPLARRLKRRRQKPKEGKGARSMGVEKKKKNEAKMDRRGETAASKWVQNDEGYQKQDSLKLNFSFTGPASCTLTSAIVPQDNFFASLCPSQFLSSSLCFSKSQYG